ncbi:ThiF family adenylyltransferase [Cytobacillus oceanisediminis]|uniref:ThiF family adenylyltransferase n=1 Tax=Cytobacillus oceanisediminis TaxID=665099 RepID=UPI001FB3A01A|nr:ThiF family adenylyltransferase [Cytobacillus oceanisediminis]UOE58133.1 ThiF family adenylyltransferase [Cytobacillus oceanisediminis]
MSIKLDFEPVLTLNTQRDKGKVFIVIGAGGTGSYFLPQLARQVAIQNRMRRMKGEPEHKILVVDADTVSLSNLNRQNFIEKDLDINKAQVLATRYGMAFGINIAYLDKYIISTDMLVDTVIAAFNVREEIPVLVDCVDNNKTRVFIHETIERLSGIADVFSLSSGNELYTGQVVCGFVPRLSKSVYQDSGLFRTPSVTDMFPEILEGGDKLPTELSCDEAAISHPQNIMTNMTAAMLLFSFANLIMTADTEDETNPGLSYFAQTFDTQNGNFRRFPNKKSVISQYIHE